MTPEAKKTLNSALELRLFGDDLTVTTDEQIIEAIGVAPMKYLTPEWIRQACDETGSTLQRIIDRHIWLKREGKPWQKSVEKYVAAYHREPRDFTTWEGMGLVLREVRKRIFSVRQRFNRALHNLVSEAKFGVQTKQMHTEEVALWMTPELVARAALAALESKVAHA